MDEWIQRVNSSFLSCFLFLGASLYQAEECHALDGEQATNPAWDVSTKSRSFFSLIPVVLFCPPLIQLFFWLYYFFSSQRGYIDLKQQICLWSSLKDSQANFSGFQLKSSCSSQYTVINTVQSSRTSAFLQWCEESSLVVSLNTDGRAAFCCVVLPAVAVVVIDLVRRRTECFTAADVGEWKTRL